MDVVVLVVLLVVFLAVVGLIVLGVVYLIGTAVGNRDEPVALEYGLRTGSAQAVEKVLDEVSPVMRWAGYELTWTDDSALCFTRRYRPVWRIVLAILFLPVGLLLLFWVNTDSLVFQFLTDGEDSRVAVNGELGHQAHKELQEALVRLGEPRRLAGWYPDGSGSERYWDGDAWTDDTRGERIVVGPRMKSAPPS